MTVTFNGGAGVSLFQQQLYGEAITYLSKFAGIGPVLNALATMDVNINFIYNGNDTYDADTNTISWDPQSALNVIQANGQIGAQSAALGLFHEIAHWLYAHTGNVAFNEFSATNLETQAALSLGEVVRPSYSSVNRLNPLVSVNNPTAHSGGGYWQAIDVNGNPIQGGRYSSSDKIVSIAGGPTGADSSSGSGGTGGSSSSGGGEHTGGSASSGGVGSSGGSSGGGSSGGGGGVGGGHWQFPVQEQFVHTGPYDSTVVHHEDPVAIVGTAEMSHM